MKSAAAVTISVLVAFALIFIIIFGGYELGWFFQNNSAQRQSHLNRSGFEAQSTYRDEATRQIDNVSAIDVQLVDPSISADEKVLLNAQRKAVVQIVCNDYNHLQGDISLNITQFAKANCQPK